MALTEKFLNHPRSWNKVTAGEVDRNRIIEFDDHGKNLDEVVVVDEDPYPTKKWIPDGTLALIRQTLPHSSQSQPRRRRQ